MKLGLLAAITALASFLAGAVQATTLVAQGISYDLTYTVIDPSTRSFTLDISGINSATDAEKGRIGVAAFAFNYPIANTQPASVVAPLGFSYMAGGLNANGCSGSGNFFCFKANTIPTGSPLAAGSTLSFVFQIATAGAFPTNWLPGFKIDWVGTKRNYDLVSLPITPTPAVPLPAAGLLLLGGLGGLAMVRRRRKA